MRRSRPLFLVYSTARSDIFKTLFWWWTIRSLYPLEVSSSRFSLSGYYISLSEWLFQSSKYFWRGCLQVSLFFAVFIVRSSNSSSSGRSKEEDDRFGLLCTLIFKGYFMFYYPSFIPAFVFYEIYQMWHWSVLIKNHSTALVCVAQQPHRGGGVGPACHAKPLLWQI